jgi:hypothetical protein
VISIGGSLIRHEILNAAARRRRNVTGRNLVACTHQANGAASCMAY